MATLFIISKLCSWKSRKDDEGPLHTNFYNYMAFQHYKISACLEWVCNEKTKVTWIMKGKLLQTRS